MLRRLERESGYGVFPIRNHLRIFAMRPAIAQLYAVSSIEAARPDCLATCEEATARQHAPAATSSADTSMNTKQPHEFANLRALQPRNGRKRHENASAGHQFKPFLACGEAAGKKRPAATQNGRRSTTASASRTTSKDSRCSSAGPPPAG